MFTKIMVALDGSQSSKKALTVALDVAVKYQARITTVSVAYFPDFADTRDEVNGVMEDAARFFAGPQEKAKAMAAELGVILDVRLVPGHPSETLSRIAATDGFDLIVMGARGRSRVKEFLLGSVSDKTVRYAPCPVLVVK